MKRPNAGLKRDVVSDRARDQRAEEHQVEQTKDREQSVHQKNFEIDDMRWVQVD